MAQGLFLGGTGRRAVAHTRPEFAKNALGPVGIPLVRGASGAGQWTQPPRKGVKAWGEGPLRPKEISRYRDTLGQIRAADNTAGRSATRHLERFRSVLVCVNGSLTQCYLYPIGGSKNRPKIWARRHLLTNQICILLFYFRA